MATPSVFFGGKISQNYEDYLGAFIFEPYAVDLAGRIDWTGVGSVLELACGSGRLTAHIAARLPPTTVFTATDLNEDMISVAKARIPSDRVKWAQADMQDLPFEPGSFDLVVCQFGIMLVPDPMKALAEIVRVLRSGGKVLFSTWTDLSYNKLWAIGDDVLMTFLGKSPMGQDPGPFVLGAEDAVVELLKRTGFGSARGMIVENTGEIESAEEAAYGFIHGLPVGLFIQKEDAALLPAILQTLEEKLRADLGDRPLRVPQKALVFAATK